MHAFTTAPAARRRSGTGLPYLVMSGLLWGTGGLTGSLLGRGGRPVRDRRRRLPATPAAC